MKLKYVRFKRKSQVTIPPDIAETLNLQEGDELQCRLEDGKIVMIPMFSSSVIKRGLGGKNGKKNKLKIKTFS
ncbi:AbrB family looped-hinge helix DNA binding protein [Geomicrobium halophilum]|uniref:AbrB family looped-hinge helix DNA binding protein n=1 Tax=Geomicrobium halophilum TaxID=549000 RepID=A0A841PLW4_9BACL|nr:AbrB/MazE/SpoVT family DNA-binding domain-containing protein [Geomicrobium halophilum]MBB6448206.1 AbrB family looped-hinge helix DNA binding protein [Geomicrobium halophilum]